MCSRANLIAPCTLRKIFDPVLRGFRRVVERVEMLRSMLDSQMEAEGWDFGDLLDKQHLQGALQVLPL